VNSQWTKAAVRGQSGQVRHMELHGSDEATGPTSGTDGSTRDGRRVGRLRRDEGGFVLVWTALFIIVLLGFAALAVDLGHSYYVGQRAQNAADAAALAGAPYLPGDLAGAQGAARDMAEANGFGADKDITISADQDPTDPAQLIVTIHQNVATLFGRAIGFSSMDVSKSATATAGGSAQATATPVDMVIVLDRTGSMSDDDIDDLRTASRALLQSLDPATDHVALAALGQSSTTTQCPGGGAYGVKTTAATNMSWMIAPSPGMAPLADYQQSTGVLDENSQIVKSIDCITAARSQSSVGTDLGDPLAAAEAYLDTYARPGAQKDILFMTDGAANRTAPDQTTDQSNACDYANGKATTAKADSINIVTVGFGVGHAPCDSHDPTFPSANATKLLASMASPINGVAAADDNDCNTAAGQQAEDTDGDNFFCPAKGSNDLASVFVTAGQQLTGTSPPRLIK
jgi:Flp pilus assembly protein TadG